MDYNINIIKIFILLKFLILYNYKYMLINLDSTYIWCLLIFLVIIILDRRDKKRYIKINNKEKFTSKIKKYIKSFYTITDSKKININYGTSGLYPPMIPCIKCGLYFKCSSIPYINTLNENVCTKCNKYTNNKHIYVMGKRPGRPRACRLLKK